MATSPHGLSAMPARSQPRPPRFLDQVTEVLRRDRRSLRTEEAYLQWIRRFILFHGKRHPQEMGAEEINAFLTHLAVRQRVSASTQNQALAALLFLYRHVLKLELPPLESFLRAQRPRRLPVVLTRDEVRALLACCTGSGQLLATLLYGSGLRLMECLRLRVQDLDFGHREVTVRSGKGDKDRRTMLPTRLIPALTEHLERVHSIWEEDRERGLAGVYLPDALARKYLD